MHTIVSDIINYIQDTQLLINKPKVISQIKNNELSQDIILIIAYIFDINIIIHENNILKVHYFSEKYNKYRNTVIFKVEHDATDGTEYYKLLIDNEELLFNYFSKNLAELLGKEYIIPIGFIPNKTFAYNDIPEKLINDRSILEIFVNKQVLEVKDAQNKTDQNKIEVNITSKNESKKEESEDELNIDDKLMLDYTNMQYNDGLESDSD